MRQFFQELGEIAKAIDREIDELLPTSFTKNADILFEAIRYSAISASKKIRGFLLVKTADIFNVNREQSLKIAAAIEMIHTYSLIHDDLPAMDDGDYRRGKPSCHKEFGEAMGILAGDALLTYAFEVIASDQANIDPILRIKIIQEITRAIGIKGMIGGQVIDITSQNMSSDDLKEVHKLKTGALIEASCVAGAIMGHASSDEMLVFREYAGKLGLIFQMVDDLIDEEDDRENANANLLNLMPIVKIKEEIEELKRAAIQGLKNLNNHNILILVGLINYIANQRK
ncbi:MAG: Geranylgeranyl pyrophosphate synthase [Candidatus Midichloria mitochondrii]|uniref:Geranyltranstransferase n=1 Tax=Midichloria mitochondrii (strain IricVA) TaxID=696127 RepID=F7XUJ0_MIDMI|nr:polyprenyl synthetase family protein [Candidatus Midichloria mitochondrii]AEI88339.1 geranyltranstransferase [Candidatus Midichloria mitochondrii IricVA]MDJ1256278.1 polyprenyl synthetase family protein [Candidatus Midichloria mitochondrii]MDJ1288330.1 polyprenyl synthetase family protein [Candidatus Midichloria mitochondrii]MDJ1298820.1 polyprenyl synthetase family protein [Candidatus Midichloria mitochondrii]MDJ1313026.1 polyprenyl synthetase family protein [Candidatus Midichloria mitocho